MEKNLKGQETSIDRRAQNRMALTSTIETVLFFGFTGLALYTSLALPLFFKAIKGPFVITGAGPEILIDREFFQWPTFWASLVLYPLLHLVAYGLTIPVLAVMDNFVEVTKSKAVNIRGLAFLLQSLLLSGFLVYFLFGIPLLPALIVPFVFVIVLILAVSN